MVEQKKMIDEVTPNILPTHTDKNEKEQQHIKSNHDALLVGHIRERGKNEWILSERTGKNISIFIRKMFPRP